MINKHVQWLLLIACVGCTQVVLPVTPQSPISEVTAVPLEIALPTSEISVDTSLPITQEDTVTVDLDIPNPQVLHAMKDLSKRQSIPLEEITLVDLEIVVWPDAGMGCPQPGMVYPQVQQDGMRIRLSANGGVYEYHSGGTRPPFLCENGIPAGSIRIAPDRNN